MSTEPTLIAETKAWLRIAAEDLRAAAHNLTASPPLLKDTLFHCQQAAVKALTGFLIWNNTPFRQTRSLEEIGERCIDLDSTLRGVVARLVPHTEYSEKFQYPGELQEPSFPEAEEALAIANDLYEAILMRLPQECGKGAIGRTEETPESPSTSEKSTRNPHAVALGRIGGKKSGKARLEKLTPEQRKEIARKAAKARWSKRTKN
jgi:HEPN domain-containing protein